MRIITSLLFVFALMLPGAAKAYAAIDAAGAAGLQKQVEDDLQWRLDMAKAFGQGLAMDGKIAVVPKGSFYEVTLPQLSLQLGPKGKIDIGTIIINATPGEKPGTWQIQTTLPASMTFDDATNAPVLHISIGSQRFSGTWWPDKEAYPKIDSLLQNIKIKGTGENALTTEIKSLQSLVDLKDNGDGTWSGPMSFEASGITLDAPGKTPVTLGIGKISSHNTYNRLNMDMALKIKQETQNALKAGLPQTDKDKQAFLAKLMQKPVVTADSMDGTLEIDQFHLHGKGAPADAAHPAPPPVDIALDQLVFSGTTTNAQQDKSKVFLKTSFDGLNVSSIPPELMDLLPHKLNAEITFDNLPIRKIADMMFTTLQQSVTTADSATNAGDYLVAQNKIKADRAAAMALVPKMLQDAGTSVSVQNTYMNSTAVDANLAGRIDASAVSPLGATGKMVLSFKGLDEFTRSLQATALKTGADPHTLGYLGGLAMLQMRGQPDKAADGKSLRNYAFEITSDGKIMLNGVNLNPAPVPVKQGPALTPAQTKPMMPAPQAPAQTPKP